MLEKIRQTLFPPEVKNYALIFSGENFRVLGYLIYGGLLLSILFAFCVYITGAGKELLVSAVHYLFFFAPTACIRYNIKKKNPRTGTLLFYLWFGLLLIYTLVIYASDSTAGAYAFFFFLLLLPLLIRDAWGRVLIFEFSFAAAFLIIELVTRSGDRVLLDLFELLIVLLAASVLSKRDLGERVSYMVLSDTAMMKAEHDVLTGIYNRRGGEQMIRTFVANEMPGAFLIIDVDDFKHINDTYGHGTGDLALVRVAQTLQNSFRETDVVMRMGGDEFIVYALGLADMQHAESKLATLRDSLHGIVLDEASGDHVTASIGCIINLGSYTDYDALFQAADDLLYGVKASAKDNYRCSDKECRINRSSVS